MPPFPHYWRFYISRLWRTRGSKDNMWRFSLLFGKIHFDYSSSLRYCLKQRPIKWSFRHVKGHQDDHKNYTILDKWGQLNVDADRLAKNCLHLAIQEHHWSPANISLPGEIGPISIFTEQNPIKVTSKLMHTLWHVIATQKAQKYWISRQIIPEHCTDLINWALLSKATKTLPHYCRRWIMKWTSVIIGVGKYMKRWNEQPHSRCPRCMQQDKDVLHVLKCPSSTATTTWSKGLDMIYQWMTNNYSAPTLPYVILHHINSWRTDRPSNKSKFIKIRQCRSCPPTSKFFRMGCIPEGFYITNMGPNTKWPFLRNQVTQKRDPVVQPTN